MNATRRTETPDQARLLTPAELELMTILWEHGQGTVRQVMAGLTPDRDLAYTSVSTILRILEQKGFVTSHKDGRTHIYAPCIERDRYQKRNVHQLVGSLFGGDPGALMRRLVTEEALSEEDLLELQQMVDERLRG